ncbi:MAG: ABC transporter substrate-binding protein [Gaiellaceae bacterium MAG52_C11]|nr:ABC transporter substrate-binding protein [Candidatus Gaiellasilicea maunaloa]
MRSLVAALAIAATLVLPASAAAPPTKTPGELLVGLAMPSAGFQVGAVRGRDVVFAKGFEIDLARELAKRLELRRVRFVNEPLFSTLLVAGRKEWDVALAQISVTSARAKRVDFSSPYLAVDQGVLVRAGLPRPGSLAALRSLQLCAERASTGGQLVLDRIKPRRKPRLLENPSKLSYELFTKRCDAIVFDAPALAVLRRQAPDRYGALAGRIVTNERYAIALERGSPLRPRLDAALRGLVADGTLERLRKRWLGTDTARLPTLR